MIREMASDDATVVIGTSIDENMKEELRVTMVATGIVDGSAGQVEKAKPVEVVKSMLYQSLSRKQIVNMIFRLFYVGRQTKISFAKSMVWSCFLIN